MNMAAAAAIIKVFFMMFCFGLNRNKYMEADVSSGFISKIAVSVQVVAESGIEQVIGRE